MHTYVYSRLTAQTVLARFSNSFLKATRFSTHGVHL